MSSRQIFAQLPHDPSWRRRQLPRRWAAGLLFCLCLHALGQARVEAAIAGLHRVASGLNSPMFATFAPGDSKRLFIGERGGTIRVLDLETESLLETPFLSIPGVLTGGEGGLLGMAFHPDYLNNGKFYVDVTLEDGVGGTPFSSYIREYTNPTPTGNVAATTPKAIMNWTQPQSNHNAGWIGFSPNNGYLYISTGDGGGSNDSDSGHTPGTGNAQDITSNFLGKFLRIDVNGDDFDDGPNGTKNYAIPNGNPFKDVKDPDTGEVTVVTGDDEIFSYGSRNPYRDSFDRATGDLWIGDVGQSAFEEINRLPADRTEVANFGWRLREGFGPTPSGGVGGAEPLHNVNPAYAYGRTGSFGGKTVIGGYIYRGPDPTLQGKYFFADAGDFGVPSSQKFWTFDPANPSGTVASIKSLLTPDEGLLRFPSAFGEDAAGNIYIVSLESNEVFRIVTDAVTPGDFDADADVDADDLALWTAGFGKASGAVLGDGDADKDGDVDGDDFLAWQANEGYSSLNVGGSGLAEAPEPGSAVLFGLAAMAMRRRRR